MENKASKPLNYIITDNISVLFTKKILSIEKSIIIIYSVALMSENEWSFQIYLKSLRKSAYYEKTSVRQKDLDEFRKQWPFWNMLLILSKITKYTILWIIDKNNSEGFQKQRK